MVTANISDLSLVNGDFGTVLKLEDESVTITVDRFGDQEFVIERNEWKQIEYEGWDETVIGTMEQIPLKL